MTHLYHKNEDDTTFIGTYDTVEEGIEGLKKFAKENGIKLKDRKIHYDVSERCLIIAYGWFEKYFKFFGVREKEFEEKYEHSEKRNTGKPKRKGA